VQGSWDLATADLGAPLSRRLPGNGDLERRGSHLAVAPGIREADAALDVQLGDLRGHPELAIGAEFPVDDRVDDGGTFTKGSIADADIAHRVALRLCPPARKGLFLKTIRGRAGLGQEQRPLERRGALPDRDLGPGLAEMRQ
jgi:hypothetical protein